jgi:hypothetical protein
VPLFVILDFELGRESAALVNPLKFGLGDAEADSAATVFFSFGLFRIPKMRPRQSFAMSGLQ